MSDKNERTIRTICTAIDGLIDNNEDITTILKHCKSKYDSKKKLVCKGIIKNNKAVIEYDDPKSKICIWQMNDFDDRYKYKVWSSLKDKISSRDNVVKIDTVEGRRIDVPTNCYYRDDNPKKHYNVFFSGGYDSLSLLIRHLEKGDFVEPFYVGFDEKGIVFAKTCISILRSIYGARLGTLKQLFTNVFLNGCEEGTFGQQTFCAFYASCINTSYLKDAIATEIAYCMNDDALSYIDELRGLYNAGMKCKVHEYKNVPLQFPLMKYSHIENCQVVYNFETKHKVIFPVTELETACMAYDDFIDSQGNIWVKYFNTEEEDYHKPNKEIIGRGRSYIIKFDYMIEPKKLETSEIKTKIKSKLNSKNKK